MTNLQVLQICGNPLGDGGVHALASCLTHIPSLTRINLAIVVTGDGGDAPGLSTDVLDYLASQLRHCTRLKYLSLASNNIRDAGFHVLVPHLRFLKSLQDLRLQGNALSDEGMRVAKHYLLDSPDFQVLW